MKELLDNIKKIFSKKLTLAVVLVIVAALAIVGLCTWYHFSIEPLGNGCNLVRRTEKGRLRRRGWGLRWEKAQKGGKGTNLRGFFED